MQLPKSVKQYSIIACPLTNLLKAETKFEFGERERKSFARLKEILYDNLILNLYEVGTESELHTDASVHGYDALAEKQWRQVYYEKPHPRRRDTRVTN